jgi:hypothetical protein
MLDASLPSNGIHKHEVSTQGGGSRSFFVATYPEPDLDAGTDVKMDESSSTKERDLESTGEKIVPAEVSRDPTVTRSGLCRRSVVQEGCITHLQILYHPE